MENVQGMLFEILLLSQKVENQDPKLKKEMRVIQKQLIKAGCKLDSSKNSLEAMNIENV
jgi:hypothetical protein